MNDTYLICGRSTILASRQDAETFLVGEGFNLPAAIHALNGVWLCGDHINLQGYVLIRCAEVERAKRIEASFGINHHSGSGCCEQHP